MSKARGGAAARQKSSGRVRIIGGELRGRWLAVADSEGLRPTGNRQREMLFNWLAPYLPGAVCLDAFAGSGALGFEAVSRGAREVVCLERDARLASSIGQQAQLLGVADRLRAQAADSLDWLTSSAHCFDIAFVDPPFSLNLWQPVLQQLANGRIRTGGLVYLEYPAGDPPFLLDACWQVDRQKRCSGVMCVLLRYTPPDTA